MELAIPYVTVGRKDRTISGKLRSDSPAVQDIYGAARRLTTTGQPLFNLENIAHFSRVVSVSITSHLIDQYHLMNNTQIIPMAELSMTIDNLRWKRGLSPVSRDEPVQEHEHHRPRHVHPQAHSPSHPECQEAVRFRLILPLLPSKSFWLC